MTTASIAAPFPAYDIGMKPLFKIAGDLFTRVKRVMPKYLVEFMREQKTFLCLAGVMAGKLAQMVVGDSNMLRNFCNACETGHMGGPPIPKREDTLVRRITRTIFPKLTPS